MDAFSFEKRLKKIDGKTYIYDIARKKYVVLTKEEGVRQQFIHYLVEVLNYPLNTIAVERMIFYNGLRKRFDIVVFDSEGKPLMLVECKAFNIKLDDNTMFQLATYNKTIAAKILVMTNGVDTKAYTFDRQTNKLLHLGAIPKKVNRKI